MTTIVYRKGKYLAADKRFIGGISSIGITEEKMTIYNMCSTEYKRKIIMGWAGDHLLVGIKNSIAEKVFKDFDISKIDLTLFDFQKKVLNYSDSFSIILIILYDGIEYAYHICDKHIEDITDNYAVLGSGSTFAEGIMLLNKDCEVGKIFELVSSKDKKTSADYNIIKL